MFYMKEGELIEKRLVSFQYLWTSKQIKKITCLLKPPKEEPIMSVNFGECKQKLQDGTSPFSLVDTSKYLTLVLFILKVT